MVNSLFGKLKYRELYLTTLVTLQSSSFSPLANEERLINRVGSKLGWKNIPLNSNTLDKVHSPVCLNWMHNHCSLKWRLHLFEP